MGSKQEGNQKQSKIMGTLIKVKITDEFFESLFKEQNDRSFRCKKGIPMEAKLLEIKTNGEDHYTAVFQLPDEMEMVPIFEYITI